MKLTTKSSSLLIAILAASTIGGTMVSAASVTELDSTGKVTVTGDGDTGGPEIDEDGKPVIPDPEEGGKTTPTNPDEVDINGEKGALKVEAVSKLNFGEVKTTAKEINQFASSLSMDGGKNRGALVTFADVRSEAFGYTLQAKMKEQFKSGENVLNGSTITYNYGIARQEDDNDNIPGSLTKGNDIVLGMKDDKTGEAVTIFTADGAKKEGKGRYVIEFGQSKEYDASVKPAPAGSNLGTGTVDTADKAVKLTIPMKTASSMAKGAYTATVTWSLATVAE